MGVVKENNSTFYDYRTGEKKSILVRIVATLVTASLISIVFQGGTDNFLSGAITAEAVLVGFGFSVMFFAASTRNYAPSAAPSIEQQIRQERLKLLTREIFYNVSYFNLVSVFSIMIALSLLLPLPLLLSKNAVSIISYLPVMVSSIIEKMFILIKYSYFTALYFLFIESSYSFLRTSNRLGFLIDRTMSENS